MVGNRSGASCNFMEFVAYGSFCALIACISSHTVLYPPSNSRKFIGRAVAASSHAGHMVSVGLAASGCYSWRSCVVVLLGRLAGRVRFGGTYNQIPCVLFDVGFFRLHQCVVQIIYSVCTGRSSTYGVSYCGRESHVARCRAYMAGFHGRSAIVHQFTRWLIRCIAILSG